MSDLRTYLEQPCPSKDSFVRHIINPIFGKDNWEDSCGDDIIEHNPGVRPLADKCGILCIERWGNVDLGGDTMRVYEVIIKDRIQLERNRVTISAVLRQAKLLGPYSSALMLFHYQEGSKDWRLSFASKEDSNKSITSAKRFTFLLGPGRQCRTAADNLEHLQAKAQTVDGLVMDEVLEAFSVEKVSDEFFDLYKKQYENFVCFITGKRFVKSGGQYVEHTEHNPNDAIYNQFNRSDKAVRDYVKLMLGRIVFLHFLQKKGWMGVPVKGNWGEGDMHFMLHLFTQATPKQQDNFLDEILEPLFEAALNTNRTPNYEYDTLVKNMPNGQVCKIPYLNGGLFQLNEEDATTIRFPKAMFQDLFEFFEQYNFTIDEDDPDEAEIGIDPEMLGRIFENLLEDNKDKGAYYTPKAVVNYMCQESLTAYLSKGLKDDAKAEIAKFVQTHDETVFRGSLHSVIKERLREVKICDPAIGSGAFPMGLLKELFLCRTALEGEQEKAKIKRDIIQQNIYGVDIERGAVDIARLRFWLSLVVDETTPAALPNLDFKIMQGNSLIEAFRGLNLSLLMQGMAHEHKDGVELFKGFESEKLNELKALLNDYFGCDDHERRPQLRQSIVDLVLEQLEKASYKIESVHELRKMDLSANESFFLWHTWFADVFQKGGFDIVIGNPPYVQLQGNGGELGAMYKNCGFETFASTGDLYCLFYEQGMRLLKEGGHLCYITSSAWMIQKYGTLLRGYFSQYDPKLLIALGKNIFESATVATNILLIKKEKNQQHTLCAKATATDRSALLSNMTQFIHEREQVCAFDTSDLWSIQSEIEKSILTKMQTVGVKLEDWEKQKEVSINFGIKTGCDEAFILETAQRNAILAACETEDERKRTEQLIRPILRGRDIKRYGYDWADKWVIGTHNGIKAEGIPPIDIEDYPAVLDHLNQYWDTISVRDDQGVTPYNLRNCAYWRDFEKEKIVWKTIGRNLAFALVEPNVYMGASGHIIVAGKRNKWLLAFLRSTTITYFIYQYASRTGMDDIMCNKLAIERIPIPLQPTPELEEAVQADDADAIDKAIYNLYGFTQEEVDFMNETIKKELAKK